MQFLPIYLYSNNLTVILDMNPLTKGVNNSMYQHDLKIQKGLKNQIKIQFKNSDQKRVRIYNTQTFIFSMFDTINNRLLIEKPLDVLDDLTTSTKGVALLTLLESDTLNLDKSSYKYSIKVRDSDGSFLPAYSNTYYGVSGTIQLLNDVTPALNPSVTITTFNKFFNDSVQKYEYKSGNIYANPEFNSNVALHTLAIYMTSYKGMLYVEATLDNDPGVNPNYSTVMSKTYDNFSGIDHINFNGVYSFVRIIYVPNAAPGESNNDNPDYFGSIDKILYRS